MKPKRKGVREIRSAAGMADPRRRQSEHGAYLALASLALQRQRLLCERAAAVARNSEIEARVAGMDRRAAVLLATIEKPAPAVRAALSLSGGPDVQGSAAAPSPGAGRAREREVSY